MLTKEQIRTVLTLEDCISAVEDGFKAFNSGKAIVPFPVALLVPDHSGDIHIKPGYIEGSDTYTIKVASGFYENPRLGLPSSHGMLVVFDARTGYPLCFEVDRCYITDLRTAAAGAVAAKVLARKRIERVAVLGTGTQARLQAEALSKVRGFRELRVWGRTPARAKACADDITKVVKAEIRPVETAEQAVRGCDVIITATMSTTPIVKAEWLSEGVHITAMGSDSPEKQELFPEVPGMADKYVCDSTKQCAELGELHHAIKAGTMSIDDVHGELGEILLGKKSGRERDDEITICDLTGIAVQDVVSAQLVYERALKKKIGTYIEV